MMFYCDECAKKRGWPESFMKSKGPCEICDRVAVCNDIPSGALPMSKLEPSDGPPQIRKQS